jgi:ubiquinone biosynthesis protein COQ4
MSVQPAIANRINLFDAVRAVGRLMKNPDDTRQVFIVIRSLRGRAQARIFRRFMDSEIGRQVMADRRLLLPVLQDAAALEKRGPDTLGARYLAFMRAESLDADGLVMPSMDMDENMPADAKFVRDRLRDAHDLNHVVTGYGREPLGELCLLAFMFAQTGNPALALIVLAGAKRAGLGRQGSRARRALLEAWRRGRKAAWLPEQDWETLLDQPLAAVRERLRLAPAPRYEAIAPSS